MTILLVFLGKTISFVSRLLNIGNGSTWPGEIALKVSPKILKDLANGIRKGIIVIAGTNGKTTTSKMLTAILSDNENTVIHNESGANLLNGIASSLLLAAGPEGKIKADYGVLEVDENTLPLLVKEITPKIVICLNLFRDQLDRYGEVDLIAEKWHNALKKLPETSHVVLNADDPQVADLSKNLKAKVSFFGLADSSLYLPAPDYATDSTYCLNCGNKLSYEGIYFSHIGNWHCDKCSEKRPALNISSWEYPLEGVYNRYNTLAAVLGAKSLGIEDEAVKKSLKNFKPAFGRQEQIEINGKKLKILLSKNPTGFNESLRTAISKNPKTIVLALNDRIPDGRDISWIWDVDFEMIPKDTKIIITGDRAYDLGLRLKYLDRSQIGNSKPDIFESVAQAVKTGLDKTEISGTLYILPTYSAMLEIRKVIGGKKIL